MASSTKRDKVTVAVVQAAPVGFDLDQSLQKLAKFTAEAAQAGAQLVLFPEAFLSAYPFSYTFDTTLGSQDHPGRHWYIKYHDSAVEIPSPAYDSLVQTARSNGVFLQVGIVEKDLGTLYCTTLLFGKDGTLLSKHRKMVPTKHERLVWGCGHGEGLDVVNTEIGKVGGLICWNNYMPAARMALYQQGIEIYLAPNADDGPGWTATTQHIAREGRCFVLSANSVVKVSDFPADYPPFVAGDRNEEFRPDGSRRTPEDVINRGGSCIVGPRGEFLAGPVWDQEAIIYATLDMDEIIGSRFDFDPVGHYSRPDIFRLTVNRKME